MEKSSAARLLTSVDSLFTTQEERDVAKQPRVQEIPIDQIDDFPNHPFKVRMDENMEQTAESVKQYGVLVPAIVRPKEDGRYEMVSGHRRKVACSLIAKQSMVKEFEAYREALQDTQNQLGNAKSELETPFAKEGELVEKSARLKELNVLLNMDQKECPVRNEDYEEVAKQKKRHGIER